MIVDDVAKNEESVDTNETAVVQEADKNDESNDVPELRSGINYDNYDSNNSKYNYNGKKTCLYGDSSEECQNQPTKKPKYDSSSDSNESGCYSSEGCDSYEVTHRPIKHTKPTKHYTTTKTPYYHHYNYQHNNYEHYTNPPTYHSNHQSYQHHDNKPVYQHYDHKPTYTTQAPHHHYTTQAPHHHYTTQSSYQHHQHKPVHTTPSYSHHEHHNDHYNHKPPTTPYKKPNPFHTAHPPIWCGPYEQYNHCGTECIPTCKNQGKRSCGNHCVAGCFCLPGYARHNGHCIPFESCPGNIILRYL